MTRIPSRGALLGISHKVSITFSNTERMEFLRRPLAEGGGTRGRARFSSSARYKETGTDYNSLLTVAAGPGVQFTINDKPGTFTFVLSPNDYAGFDAAVAKVSAYLGSK